MWGSPSSLVVSDGTLELTGLKTRRELFSFVYGYKRFPITRSDKFISGECILKELDKIPV